MSSTTAKPPTLILTLPNSNNQQTIQLLPASFDDITSMARIFVEAHDHAEVTVYNAMKDCSREDVTEFYASAFRSCWKHDKTFVFKKIVDVENDEIIGFTIWHHPPGSMTKIDHWPPYPAGSNIPLSDHFFGQMETIEKKWSESLGGGDDFYALKFTSISPLHQRKGIATWALKPTLDLADAAGKKSFVAASPGGARLYKQLGFEEVDFFEVDFETFGLEGRWGGDDEETKRGEWRWQGMIREPRAKGGEVVDVDVDGGRRTVNGA